MQLEAEVCVVGGGPGGALLAYLLAMNNVSAVLVERHKTIDKEFRGEHLNEEGESILRKYGLYRQIENEGLLPMDRVEYWEKGAVIKTIYPSEGSSHVGIHVPQKNLLSAIFNASDATPHYKRLMGTRVTSIVKNEKGEIAGIRAKNDQEEITIRCRLVIGADGRFSTVRKLARISFETRNHGYDLLWAKIPAPEGWNPVIRKAVADGRELALFSQAGGYIQIGWQIAEGSYALIQKRGIQQFIKMAEEEFPDLAENIRLFIHSWKDFVPLDVFSSRCHAWTQKGLAIMGDAAHTMSPTGAFGLNAALADAEILASVVSKSVYRGEISLESLKMYEEIRRGPVETLQNKQLEMETGFLNHFKRPILV